MLPSIFDVILVIMYNMFKNKFWNDHINQKINMNWRKAENSWSVYKHSKLIIYILHGLLNIDSKLSDGANKDLKGMQRGRIITFIIH